MNEKYQGQAENFKRIQQAIEFLEDKFQEQPDLEAIAASVHLSKYHFQRIFKEWAGVTPLQFLHYLTVEYAREQLRNSQNVLETSLRSGLSGPGRLHDLFVTLEGVTPGDHRRLGESLLIRHGLHPTPFGECLLAVTDRGICGMRFAYPADSVSLLEELKSEWPQAEFKKDLVKTGEYIRRIFNLSQIGGEGRLRLYVRGTNFQIQIWKALLHLDPGDMVSYQDVGSFLGSSRYGRAVGNAVAKNPVAYLIPCHRVIRKTGKVHRYRWGSARKKAILGWEACRT